MARNRFVCSSCGAKTPIQAFCQQCGLNLQGIAPTGRQVAVPGFVFYRITIGKIVEFRGLFDGLSMLHQLGAMPASQQAGA